MKTSHTDYRCAKCFAVHLLREPEKCEKCGHDKFDLYITHIWKTGSIEERLTETITYDQRKYLKNIREDWKVSQ